jgi:beta-lactamase superfamily II metal-dependent hydrolase
MFEIDFLPVEHGEKSGDAIAFRFTPTSSWGDQIVCVVDGGYEDEGKALVDHIRTYYDTERVDLVFSTHPDADHVTGLEVVLSELNVGELFMHLPWRRSAQASPGRAGRDNLRAALSAATDLEALARRLRIPIIEPFAGEQRFDRTLTVVGPSLDFYESLLPEFEGMPTVKEAVAQFLHEARARVKQVGEALDIETLDDSGEITPENNSSVVLLLQLDGHRLLLTADAGMPALEGAVDFMDLTGLYGPLDFIQVPHHGSRRNVGPTILNRLLGGYPQEPRMTAFVSASNDAPKHPSKQVANAFRRRGAPVVSTEGKSIYYRSPDAPRRPNWGPVEPMPLFTTVEIEE